MKKKRLLAILLTVMVVFTSMAVTAFAGQWKSDTNGWRYYDDNDNLVTGWINRFDTCKYYGDPNTGYLWLGWHKIGGSWYYFAPEDEGYIKYNEEFDEGRMYDQGVMPVGNYYYYFATSDNASKWGKMQTGWIKESGQESNGDETWNWECWYYADPNNDSRLVSGWKKIGDKWYYFEPDKNPVYYGEMYANDIYEINGKSYAFNRGGSLHDTVGWVDLYEEWIEGGQKQKKSYWTYTDKNGIVATGWKKIDGVWYYFGDYEYMWADDWAEDSIGWMYMGANGKAVTNKWIKDDGEWYYLKANGYQAESEWCKVDGYWYYFDENGAMVSNDWAKDSAGWMYMGANGKAVTNKWIKDDGEWYYLKASGYMAKNEWAKDGAGWMYMGANGKAVKDKWIKSGGYWYYLKDTGYMAANEWAYDSVGRLRLDASGKIIKNKIVDVGGAYYYVNGSGYMVTNQSVTINGVTYYADENGQLSRVL